MVADGRSIKSFHGDWAEPGSHNTTPEDSEDSNCEDYYGNDYPDEEDLSDEEATSSSDECIA
eukprot:scaffold70309_cov54-Prasinocladus_malaysianus.AAC.1